MGIVVTAVYEKGVLRPLRPLSLADNETVTIEVRTESEEQRLIRELVAANVLTAPPGAVGSPPLTEEERQALAERLGQAVGGSVADMIIEERQQR